MSIKAVIKRRPVVTYFALTFAISWGGVLAVVGPGGFPGTTEQMQTLLPAAVLVMILGPSVAGILLTGLVYGSTGLRRFTSSLVHWRVGARWYAVLLIAPLGVLAILLPLSLISSQFLPGIFVSPISAPAMLLSVAIALGAGIFEELGWTAFATPRLMTRHGVLGTGLIIGLFWAAWHLLVAFWASGTVSGPLALTSYLLDPFLFLAVFRILIVWVYDRTGSLFMAILMHVSLTGSARILTAPGVSGGSLLAFDVVWASLMWVVILAVARVNGGHLSRPAFHHEAA